MPAAGIVRHLVPGKEHLRALCLQLVSEGDGHPPVITVHDSLTVTFTRTLALGSLVPTYRYPTLAPDAGGADRDFGTCRPVP
jgi:hypothetical protein